jgi:hypothetical protein
MSGDIESVGDVVTGGLVAAAVERERATGHGDGAHGDTCLNCQVTLTGPFCAQCGQSSHIHRSVHGLMHDILHGVFHFEGKVWRTLPELALRPGQLTRRYIHGERAKFISPMALFLFSAFLLYAVYSLTADHQEGAVLLDTGAAKELQQERSRADEQVERIEERLKTPSLSPEQKETLQADLVEARQERDAIGTVAAMTEEGSKNAPRPVRGLVKKLGENPDFVFYKMKSNAYKYSWALIVISTPLLWLLFFWRREYRMYDHAIFVTYSIAFMSLLFSATMIMPAIGITTGLVTLAAMLFACWHMYRQLKDAYRLSRRGTLWRLPLLYGFACAALGLFAAILTASS